MAKGGHEPLAQLYQFGQKLCLLSPIKVVENMFNLGCTATSFLDLLISVERCTVNIGHNYKQHLFTVVCIY